MIKKYGLMVRLPLFLLVSLAMLTAGPSIAADSAPTVTEEARGLVCMNRNHTIIDGKCVGSKKISRPQADSNETGDFSPYLGFELEGE